PTASKLAREPLGHAEHPRPPHRRRLGRNRAQRRHSPGGPCLPLRMLRLRHLLKLSHALRLSRALRFRRMLSRGRSPRRSTAAFNLLDRMNNIALIDQHGHSSPSSISTPSARETYRPAPLPPGFKVEFTAPARPTGLTS